MTSTKNDPNLENQISAIAIYLTECGLTVRKSPLGLVWIVLPLRADYTPLQSRAKYRFQYIKGRWYSNNDLLQRLIGEALKR